MELLLKITHNVTITKVFLSKPHKKLKKKKILGHKIKSICYGAQVKGRGNSKNAKGKR